MNKLLNDAPRAKGYAGQNIKMVLTDVTDSNEGNLTAGVRRYESINWNKGIVEVYDTIGVGVNFSNSDIGVSAGISILSFAASEKDIEGRGKIIGADFDSV